MIANQRLIAGRVQSGVQGVRGVVGGRPRMIFQHRAFLSTPFAVPALELSPSPGLESCCGSTFLGCLRPPPLLAIAVVRLRTFGASCAVRGRLVS